MIKKSLSMVFLDIVGFIKIDPEDKLRKKYLLATLQSYEFISDCKIQIAIETSRSYYDQLCKNYPWVNFILIQDEIYTYGDIYSSLLAYCESEFVLNFIEDHFMVTNDQFRLRALTIDMTKCDVDVSEISFYQINTLSLNGIQKGEIQETENSFIYSNTLENFNRYRDYYGHRFYLGVNAIFRIDFAKKFWGRNINSPRPHLYEIPHFDNEFFHKVLIPKFEVQASIDDDHGEYGTCLLRRNSLKFELIRLNIGL